MIDITQSKILITGGTGHLGSALTHYLVQQRKALAHNIRIFYLPNSPTQSLDDIQGLDMFAGNVLNADEVQAACKGVEIVFHLIGSTTFDTRQQPLQWQVNVEGTRNVLEAYRQSTTIKKLCYTSTVNVLGVPNPIGNVGNFNNSNPYTNTPRLHSFVSVEDTLRFIAEVKNDKNNLKKLKNNIGYYDSKLAAQELVNDYVKRFNLNITSVLPGTMFGPYDHLIGTGLYLISLYNNQMPVVLKGGLPLAHVMDVAEGHVLAMEKAVSGSHYILSGFENDNHYLKDMCSIIVQVLQQRFPDKKFNAPKIVVPAWLAMAAAYVSEHYAKAFNKPMLLSRSAVKPGAYPSFYSSKNAIEDLGYQPKHSFKQAVEDMLDYYIKHNLLQSTGRWIDKIK